jgi:N-acetylmuramoyl-L-alanine amidase
MLFAQNDHAPVRNVTAIRNWSLNEVTRIAIEVSGDFRYRTDRLHNPERVYFDILNSRPHIDARRFWSHEINDHLVQKVRMAETAPGTTRVVIDLAGAVEVTTSQLSNPNRLIVEVRAGGGPTIPTEGMPVPGATKVPVPIKAELPKVEMPKVEAPKIEAPKSEPTVKVEGDRPGGLSYTAPEAAATAKEAVVEREPPAPVPAPVPGPVVAPPAREVPMGPPVAKSEAPASTAPATPAEFGKAARHTTSGGSSLTRALGLKIARVVIDAGHGGHDQGTQGPHGLIEKELVLDVALRVGKLIEERMNAEVIYTRSDDTFIPLEGRTALANEKKADLFLSIHANSSPYPRISGVETYYLNFTDSKDALDVASRENASSQKSIFELQDIIHKITLHEKLDESREFAGRMQASLFSFSSHNIAGEKNRGVKKAPFVVLIGANMPSVLAEIGFVTNTREETLLKKSDYRQKLADALYRGVAKYAEGLSHFQMAQN